MAALIILLHNNPFGIQVALCDNNNYGSSVLSYSKKIAPVNWIGKHSLVIMLVHFPIQERLNQVVFGLLQTYDLATVTKIILAIVAYIITLSFSIGAVIFCRRFIPKLSGYSNLVPVK